MLPFQGEDDEAISYFANILPKIKAQEKEHLHQIEFIQYPGFPLLFPSIFISDINTGDTVFVPGGWWHAVVNLDCTMALTQNFMSSVNFERVWRSLRKERKRLSVLLLSRFKEKKPELYLRALKLNEDDGFAVDEDQKKIVNLKRKRVFEVKEGEIVKKRKISMSSDTESSSSSSSSSDGE